MRWILLILCGLISAYAQASQLNNLLPPVRLAVVNSFGSNLSVRYFNGTVNAIAKAVAPRRLVVQFYDQEVFLEAAQNKEFDLAIASSGLTALMTDASGAAALLTNINSRTPDPNHANAGGHFMKLHINRQELQAAFTGNVRFTENFALRLIPVVLKNPVMALNYRLFGVRPYSCTYTNPGAFTVPPEMAAHIRGAEVILGQATVPRCHCASISYGDTMEITFAGTQAETDTERDFFRFLVREGIPVRVESNR